MQYEQLMRIGGGSRGGRAARRDRHQRLIGPHLQIFADVVEVAVDESALRSPPRQVASGKSKLIAAAAKDDPGAAPVFNMELIVWSKSRIMVQEAVTHGYCLVALADA